MYTEKVADDDDVMTVEQFIKMCMCGALIDYDGFGHAVKNGYLDPTFDVTPSYLGSIPDDATHIVWYNR